MSATVCNPCRIGRHGHDTYTGTAPGTRAGQDAGCPRMVGGAECACDVDTNPSAQPEPGLYVRRVHPDGATTTVRLDEPGMRAVLREAVIAGSSINRAATVSSGRAGNIVGHVVRVLTGITEKEPPG